MIKLTDDAKQKLECVAKYNCSDYDCEHCPLEHCANPIIDCQKAAKELLNLIDKQELYQKNPSAHRLYTETTLGHFTKKELIEIIQEMQSDNLYYNNVFDRQAATLCKFWGEHKGELEVTLKWKEKEDE